MGSLRPLVQAKAQVYGPESFWSLLNRAYQATYRTISPKHLQWYLGIRRPNPDPAQMVRGLVGKRLSYRELIGADNHDEA